MCFLFLKRGYLRFAAYTQSWLAACGSNVVSFLHMILACSGNRGQDKHQEAVSHSSSCYGYGKEVQLIH